MSAVPSPVFDETPQRIFPRHRINVPLDLIALRSGVPENLPGRCTDISEAGVGAVVAGELATGQQVAVELRLPNVGVPVRARALVRYQSRLRCGLEFVGLTAEQREMIRYWVYRSAAQLVDLRDSKKAENNEPATPEDVFGRRGTGGYAKAQSSHRAARILCADRLHAGAGRSGMVAVAEVLERTGKARGRWGSRGCEFLPKPWRSGL